jgi:ABC-type transport system involved in multi-copper enzyme maturation permease subunit
LSARIDAVKRAGLAADARPLVRSLYMRLVVSVAPLVLGLFAIAVCSSVRTGWKSTLIGFAVTIAYIAFYAVINPATYWSATSRVQPFPFACLPNVLVVFLAHSLFRRSLTKSG